MDGLVLTQLHLKTLQPHGQGTHCCSLLEVEPHRQHVRQGADDAQQVIASHSQQMNWSRLVLTAAHRYEAKRRTAAACSTYSPLGSTFAREITRSRLSTSLSMLRATPGYCTLSTTRCPVGRVPPCTCMQAECISPLAACRVQDLQSDTSGCHTWVLHLEHDALLGWQGASVHLYACLMPEQAASNRQSCQQALGPAGYRAGS